MNRRAFLASATCCVTSASAGAQTLATPRFGAASDYCDGHNGGNLIVVRNGVVLAEHYAPGLGPTDLLPMGAGARALSTLLAASLTADGLLRLDEAVAMTLGDWGADPVKASITIEMLLAGLSGIAFAPGGGRTLADAIALTPQAPPGSHFIDDPASYVIFAEIARRKLEADGQPPDPANYVTNRTLGVIGCSPVGWARSADGAPLLYDGAAATGRGWAGVGELIRREGVWRAEQLVDGYTLREAVHGSLADPRAGMGLWIAAGGSDANAPFAATDLWHMIPPAPADLVMAAGQSGERLYIVPSQHLVIACQPRDASGRGWSDAAFLPLIWRDL
ncbi:MAG: serine hydrolase [Alphaproteobacteria bacterium]